MTASADDPRLQVLARLVVGAGLNIQPKQPLIIHAPIEARQLVRCVLQVAYDVGAGPANCIYEDPELLRVAVASMDTDRIRSIASALSAAVASMPTAAQLTIVGPRPSLLQGIATERLLNFHKLCAEQDVLAGLESVRCTVPFATRDWATWIRPNLESGAAQAALWDDILHLCGINTDSHTKSGASARHERLDRVADWLNRLDLVSLHLRDQDTDLSVDLLQQAPWHGGMERTAAGVAYLPSLPSGPVQRLLQASGTHGLLSVKQPITIGANSVCDLKLEFLDGRVSRLSASQGADVMEQLLQANDNDTRLGQIGLVEAAPGVVPPQDGFMAPIMDKACGMHVTLGCPADAKHQPGVNYSDIGIDVMFGGSAMVVDGVDASGVVVPLFRYGRFCLSR